MDGFLRDGHKTFLGAFTLHFDELVIEEKVAQFQVDQFRHAKPATEKRFDDGFVALTFGLTEVNDRLDGIDFIHGKNIGQVLRLLGKFQQFGGIDLQHIAEHQEMIETPYT